MPDEQKKFSLGTLLFGKPIASIDERGEHVGIARGVPIFGLDALSSAAYGPEAALAILIPVGIMGLQHIIPIITLIVVLLFIVFLSYRQTIPAYPNGGGSYTVASENLGRYPGLLSGSALMVDYILTAAVGIASGVGAIVSAFPSLQKHTVLLCLVILALLTLVNLRGVRDAGAAFMIPTYVFIVSLLAMIGVGLYRGAVSGWHPVPVVPPPAVQHATEMVSLWLLLKAFASGCTAMTGVEAVSNGVRAFDEPRAQTAARTLTLIVILLMIMLLGVGFLSWMYHTAAMPQEASNYQTLLSLLLEATVGRGVLYYIAIASIVAVLALSANTAYADFPRLCHSIAADGYMPFSFTLRGRRLVYSSGVYALSIIAALLLIAFKGITDKLIPLYAVGAFTAFTLSQAGMVVHWLRNKQQRGWQIKMFFNGVGALATGLTTVIVLVAKFLDGAWITALVIPALILFMVLVHRHYQHIRLLTRTDCPIDTERICKPAVIMPVGGWSTITANALQFAMSISDEIHALHVLTEEEDSRNAVEQWKAMATGPARAHGFEAPELVLLESPYRQVIRPIMNYILTYRKKHPKRHIAVLLPELVESHWFYYLLHNQRANALKGLLYLQGDHYTSVINVPWYIGKAQPDLPPGDAPRVVAVTK